MVTESDAAPASMTAAEADAVIIRVADAARREMARRGRSALAVALSGGVDSRFLCHALTRAGIPVLALHARGPHVPAEESRRALRWAEERSIPFAAADFDPLKIPEVTENGRQRCYFCKAALMRVLLAEPRRREEAGEPPRVLCEGSNADDEAAARPGLRALREAGVLSPLAAAGVTKAALRAAGAATGLDDPDQIARPCLLTRLAYSLPPSRDVLLRLEAAEAELSALRDSSGRPALGDFRLRLTPEPLLQARRLPESIRAEADAILLRHGFSGWKSVVENHVSGLYDRL